jgi:hypothetical protein
MEHNLPGRPLSIASWCIRSASVSEAEGLGAKPGEAAIIILSNKDQTLILIREL